ncbi:MAG: metal-dependent hydrolase [Myxococcota bacterium]
MTPVGHAAFSYVIGRAAARGVPISVAGMVLGGVLPDIDFAVIWAPQFNEWHRVVTHNVFFCGLAAAVAGVVARARGAGASTVWPLVLGVFVGGLGHLLTDSTMDTNASNGIGVAWLWPLTREAYSPFNLMGLLGRPDNTAGWNDLGAAALAVLAGLVWELPWWLGAAWLWRGRERPPAG